LGPTNPIFYICFVGDDVSKLNLLGLSSEAEIHIALPIFVYAGEAALDWTAVGYVKTLEKKIDSFQLV
jgi:hypothetical protein